MESKILDVYWISGIKTIGIVAVENDMGEVSFRIAPIAGENMDEDQKYIRDHGMKLYVDGLLEFFTKHKKNEDKK